MLDLYLTLHPWVVMLAISKHDGLGKDVFTWINNTGAVYEAKHETISCDSRNL
jgi:hypothetical protein